MNDQREARPVAGGKDGIAMAGRRPMTAREAGSRGTVSQAEARREKNAGGKKLCLGCRLTSAPTVSQKSISRIVAQTGCGVTSVGATDTLVGDAPLNTGGTGHVDAQATCGSLVYTGCPTAPQCVQSINRCT